MFGVIAVTFGVGLGTSLDRVYNDLSHSASEPVQVNFPGGPPQGRMVKAGRVLARPAEPGRAGTGGRRPRCAPSPARCTTWPKPTTMISALGLSDRLSLTGFDGDAQLDRLRPDRRALVLRQPDRPTSTPPSSPTPAPRWGQLHAHLRRQAPHRPDRRGDLRPGRRPAGDHRQPVHPGRPRSGPGPRSVRRGAEAGHRRPGLRGHGGRHARAGTTRSASTAAAPRSSSSSSA